MKNFWIYFIITIVGTFISYLVNILLVIPDDKKPWVILGGFLCSAIIAWLTTQVGYQKTDPHVNKLKQKGRANKFKVKGNSRVENIQMIGDENEIDIGDSQSNAGKNP